MCCAVVVDVVVILVFNLVVVHVFVLYPCFLVLALVACALFLFVCVLLVFVTFVLLLVVCVLLVLVACAALCCVCALVVLVLYRT